MDLLGHLNGNCFLQGQSIIVSDHDENQGLMHYTHVIERAGIARRVTILANSDLQGVCGDGFPDFVLEQLDH